MICGIMLYYTKAPSIEVEDNVTWVRLNIDYPKCIPTCLA